MSALGRGILEVVDLSKRFGAFQALDRVSLQVAAGSVHALLGENGAGKSTLVKCVMGYHRHDGGRILLEGRPIRPGNPRQAQALGIGMVYQHFTLIPNMTVAENLVLSRARLPLVIDWRQEGKNLAAFMAKMPFQVPLAAPVRSLSAGEKQKLEILKQLYLDSRVIILDEPTSVLTPAEADEVLGLLRRRTRESDVSILMISHKFREVMKFADEVTVLRRGRLAGRGRVEALTPAAMAEMMVGGTPPADNQNPSTAEPGPPVLRLDGLCADDDLGAPALFQVGLDVRAGEIVGIAAVAGNGQEELVEVLGGQRPKTAGTIYIHGREYQGSRMEIERHKVRCLPEDPLRNACVPNMSVAENMAFHDFDRPPARFWRWFVSKKTLLSRAAGWIEAFKVKTRSPETLIGELSGGNVQRAVLARELSGPVEVLVVANPCMGLDFAAVVEIHERLRQARDTGAAVLLVSADLDELLALSDRLLVMSDGRLVHETTPATADLARVGQFMAGHDHHKERAA